MNLAGAFYLVVLGIARVLCISPEYSLNSLTSTTGFTMTNGGDSVNAAGDINGDGIDDVIIGVSWKDSNTGMVAVIFGQKGQIIQNLDLSTFVNGPTTGFRILAAAPGVYSGFSVSKAGDVNGDGIDDVIIGAWESDIVICNIWSQGINYECRFC